MSNDAVENRIDAKILEEAAEYYLSLQDESMSGAELKAWQAWFMRSDEHQLAFKRLESLWGALEHLSVEDFASIELQEEADAVESSASGASVIGMIAPAKEEATTSTGMRWFTGIAASFAAVMVAGYMALTPAGVGPNPINEVPYFTTAGEQRVVHLSDGSILELGPDSEVNVGYTPTERALELVRGQAIFTVSKNPNRPFVVRAGNGSVTAIGTVFNVRRMDEDVRVRVLEGTVAVRPTSENEVSDQESNSQPVALVSAGNQTLYGDEGAMTPVEEADVHDDLAWRVGVLTMVNRELSDVIQQLNRYVQSEIAIGDNAIGKFHFTGTVYPDKVDEWLEGLTQGYPLKVVRVGGRTILMLDDSAATH